MIKLNLEEVKDAARKAYDEGRLTAQAPVYSQRLCQYAIACTDGIVRVCGIGAAMPIETALAHATIGSITGGGHGLFTIENVYDTQAIEDVQSYHDSWADAENLLGKAQAEGDETGVIAYAERHADHCKQDFLRIIDHPEAKA